MGVNPHGTSTPIAEAVSEYSGGVSLVTIWVPSAIDELGSAPWETRLHGRKISFVALIHNADPPRHCFCLLHGGGLRNLHEGCQDVQGGAQGRAARTDMHR